MEYDYIDTIISLLSVSNLYHYLIFQQFTIPPDNEKYRAHLTIRKPKGFLEMMLTMDLPQNYARDEDVGKITVEYYHICLWYHILQNIVIISICYFQRPLNSGILVWCILAVIIVELIITSCRHPLVYYVLNIIDKC